MDARAIAEGISDGVNAIWGLIANVSPRPEAPPSRAMAPSEVADGLDGMEQALCAFIDSKTVEASFRPSEEDLHRVRRLHQLVTVWRDTGVAAVDLIPLADECLAAVSAWR
ncbi:MAG: hypothetical protein JWP87_52 [Labilithrix sp.]|nr:hypothetical protein [Labilithrix sp.]